MADLIQHMETCELRPNNTLLSWSRSTWYQSGQRGWEAAVVGEAEISILQEAKRRILGRRGLGKVKMVVNAQ
jgi:hypothetical protein